jgi:hypothetical protein
MHYRHAHDHIAVATTHCSGRPFGVMLLHLQTTYHVPSFFRC